MCRRSLCRCLGLGGNSCGCGGNSVAGATEDNTLANLHVHCHCNGNGNNNSVAGAETTNNCPDQDSNLRRCIRHCLKNC